jgi:hypothetical protein
VPKKLALIVMNKTKTIILSLFLLGTIFSFTPVYAQTSTLPVYNPGVDSQIKQYLCTPDISLFACINQLYKFAIVVAAVVGVFFIVIAGYLYMSSGGSDESVKTAKDMLTSTIASLVILMAGYILLKAINPDLIQFHPISPPGVTLPADVGLISPGTPVSDKYTTPNNSATDLAGSGCAFQQDKQKNEAPQMVSLLANKVKSICYNIVYGTDYPNTKGYPPTISSIIGVGYHTPNSYHYKGCAVDFADGKGNGFFDPRTKTGRPTGVAIYQEALKAGLRIDPGTDGQQSFHIHLDLGTACTNSGADPNAGDPAS